MAVAVGMIVSCFRWLVIDHLMEWTGVPKADGGHPNMAAKLDVFEYLIQGHYRYYQFYGNTLIAIMWAYLINRWIGTLPLLGLGTDLGVLILSAVLLTGARDALMKFRKKIGRVLG
jgi:hypothetical protein